MLIPSTISTTISDTTLCKCGCGKPTSNKRYYDKKYKTLEYCRGHSFSRAWTDEEIKFLKENYLKKSAVEIGNLLNRSLASVHIKASNSNIKKFDPPINKLPSLDSEIKNLYISNKYITAKELGKEIGYSKTFVLKRLHFMNLKPRNRIKSRLKATDEETVEMYHKYNSYSQIGNALGLSQMGVMWRIKKLGLLPKIKQHSGDWNRIKINSHFFDQINHVSAYVLGYIAADGCISKLKNNSYHITITGEKELLLDIKKAMKSDHKLYFYPNKRFPNNHTHVIKFVDKQISSKLLSFGIHPNKSKSIQLPTLVQEFYPAFFRGYFDGDGSISRNKNDSFSVNITSGSYKFLEQSKAKLEEFGITSANIYSRKESKAHNLRFRKDEIIQLYHFFYQKAPVFLQRKKKMFDYFITKWGLQICS